MLHKGLALTALSLLAPFWAAQAAPSRLAELPALKPSLACASLSSTDLSKAVGAKVLINAATEVAGEKPYCKVTGSIDPKINFEVRLPVQGWTQRYLQTGCGGLCGGIRLNADKAEDCTPVINGEIALASTDMGHQGMEMGWGSNAQQRADFAHRGVHLTALAAKALIKAYYGKAPRYSYFSGCSDGAREALMEAQRYPDDFDGIAAGAPALNFTVQNSFYHAWMALSNTRADGTSILNPADLVPLHKGALKACDAIDGLVDGQIDDPRRCKFDPVTVDCGNLYPESGKCLTSEQVAAARKLYAGARDAHGRKLVIGSVQPGSELSWTGVFIPRTPGGDIFGGRIALETINNLLFTPNPATPYTLASWKFDAATLASLEEARKLYNADDPNLSSFAKRGGKLILWHGWSDPHISPLNTLDYYQEVGKAMGMAKRGAFARLFLFPAMYHCAGGDGPSNFALLSALMSWVEGGAAPQVMIANNASKQAEQASTRSRPVYAYPVVARYSGKGSIDDAANFKPFTPTANPEQYDWLGKRR